MPINKDAKKGENCEIGDLEQRRPRGRVARAVGDDLDQRRRVVVHGDHDSRDDHRALEIRVAFQRGGRGGQAKSYLLAQLSQNAGQRENVVEAEFGQMSGNPRRLSLREQGAERREVLRSATELADGANHQVLDISGEGGEHRHSEKAGGPRARDRRGVLDYADGR